eukprot:scpid76961/ scgid11540/ 
MDGAAILRLGVFLLAVVPLMIQGFVNPPVMTPHDNPYYGQIICHFKNSPTSAVVQQVFNYGQMVLFRTDFNPSDQHYLPNMDCLVTWSVRPGCWVDVEFIGGFKQRPEAPCGDHALFLTSSIPGDEQHVQLHRYCGVGSAHSGDEIIALRTNLTSLVMTISTDNDTETIGAVVALYERCDADAQHTYYSHSWRRRRGIESHESTDSTEPAPTGIPGCDCKDLSLYQCPHINKIVHDIGAHPTNQNLEKRLCDVLSLDACFLHTYGHTSGVLGPDCKY